MLNTLHPLCVSYGEKANATRGEISADLNPSTWSNHSLSRSLWRLL